MLGYIYRGSQTKVAQPTKTKTRNVYLSLNEKHRAKLSAQTDSDRIRELNLLSPNESKFMRLLQHQFIEHGLVIKDRRFYVLDQNNYPIAIFEYCDGSQAMKLQDKEDGVPLFLYKAILSSESLAEDKAMLFRTT